MPKRKKKDPTPAELGANIYKDYLRWKDIYNGGCVDPSYSDGVNIELVRNHIIGDRLACEQVLGNKYYLYPDEYYFPMPPSLPWTFMAEDRYLPCKGETLTKTKTVPYSEVFMHQSLC